MTPPHILYAEDDDDLRSIVAQQLSRAGFEVTAVSSAEDALALMVTRKFDALLTDYQLTGQNAAWLLSEATARGLIKRTSVVVMSADRKPAGIAGCTFLRKPADLPVIVESLRMACARVTAMKSCIAQSRTLIRTLADGVSRLDERMSTWAFRGPWQRTVIA